MKTHFKLLVVLTLSILVSSCGNTDKKATHKTNEPQTSTEKNKTEFNKLREKLKHTEPIPFEDLKTWLPESLDGIPLKSSRSLFPMYKGQSEILGRYDDLGNKKMIGLNLFDAAGEEGWSFSGQIPEYRKVLPDKEVGGIQMRTGFKVKDWFVRQSFTPEKNVTSISFFHENRILLKLNAHGYNVEEAWDIIGELDFRALSALVNE